MQILLTITARESIEQAIGAFVPCPLKAWYKKLVKYTHTQGISEQVREMESRVLTPTESKPVTKLSDPKYEVRNLSTK